VEVRPATGVGVGAAGVAGMVGVLVLVAGIVSAVAVSADRFSFAGPSNNDRHSSSNCR
jgi:hypothetical protein